MTGLRAIPGLRAIVVAETFGVPLYKYTDSTERTRALYDLATTTPHVVGSGRGPHGFSPAP